MRPVSLNPPAGRGTMGADGLEKTGYNYMERICRAKLFLILWTALTY